VPPVPPFDAVDAHLPRLQIETAGGAAKQILYKANHDQKLEIL
jgi:hypothetical protein